MEQNPFPHTPVVGAELYCEFGENMRLTNVEYEDEEMIGIEILLDNDKIVAYPITPDTARSLARQLIALAKNTERRQRGR